MMDWQKHVRSLPIQWIQQQRWFRKKGKEDDLITFRDAALLTLDVANAPFLSVIALVDIGTEQNVETYCLPLIVGPHRPPETADVIVSSEDGWMADGSADPFFLQSLQHCLFSDDVIPGLNGHFRFFHPTDAPMHQCRSLSVDSSNSLALIDNRQVIKWIRHPHAGDNHELQMNVFFAQQTRWRGLPLLTAALSYETPNQPPTTIAILFHFVENSGNLWEVIQHYLRHELQDAARSIAEGHHPGPLHTPEIAVLIQKTGYELASMHQVLLQATSDHSFSAEPVTKEDLSLWANELAIQAQEILETLRHWPYGPGYNTLSMLPWDRWCTAIPETFRILQRFQPDVIKKCRIHGDFHFGQVLVSRDKLYIMDFEGEPLRPPSERTRKEIPLKDLAGVCRSISYAASAARFEFAPHWPEYGKSWLENALSEWAQASEKLLIDSYRTVESELSFSATKALLSLFKLSKAVYELHYEAHHRPEWIGVPAAGIRECLDEAIVRLGMYLKV